MDRNLILLFNWYFMMNRKTILFLTFFLLLQLYSYADIDSLKLAFGTAINSEERLKIGYKIAKQTISSQPDTAIKYLYAALKDSSENPNSENLGNCLNGLGVYHFNNHNFDSVIYYASRALKICIDNGNPTRGIVSRKNIALAQRSQGDYQQALKSFFEILEFYKSDSNDVRVAATLNDIGNTYLYLKDYQKGIHYQNEALKYIEGYDNDGLRGNIYNSFGYAYSTQWIDDSAIFYYEKSLELKLKSGDIYGIVSARNNLCTQIDYKKKPDKCEECFLELLNDQKKINDSKGIARTYLNLAVSDYYHKKCSLAIKRLDSVAFYLGFSDDIFLKQKYLKQRAKALQNCGKNTLAYLYLDSLMKLNDSIFEFQKQKEIFELDAKYKTQQKEENIKMLEAKNELTIIKVQKQRWQISFLIFFLVIFIGGGTLAFFLLKQRQRKLKELAILKMREEERVRIARDMHDEIGSGLTRISFMSEQIKLQKDFDRNFEGISKVIEQSRNLSKNLREIIWAIDPTNDKLSELLFYMHDYINEFSDNTAIRCNVDFPDDVADIEVASEIRRNLFLALKEILNNIAKHADAETVEIKFCLKNKLGVLVVEDNGKGFDQKTIKKGVGLGSIKTRTEKLNGVFKLNSKINKGTIIKLKQMTLNTTKV